MTTDIEQRGLRAILVDDERLARKRFRALLAPHPRISIVAEAHDISSARACLAEFAPEVVFLDIQLQGESGFDLIPYLPARTELVFVTAHDAYALRAFEANALDYLLKPVSEARLATTVGRLLGQAASAGEKAAPSRLTLSDPIIVRDGRQWLRLDPSTLAAIQGEGTYSRLIATSGDDVLTLRTLTDWMDRLPSKPFVRLSRSLIVNLALVERLEALTRDHARLHLKGLKQPVKLGRVASAKLRKHLQDSE